MPATGWIGKEEPYYVVVADPVQRPEIRWPVGGQWAPRLFFSFLRKPPPLAPPAGELGPVQPMPWAAPPASPGPPVLHPMWIWQSHVSLNLLSPCSKPASSLPSAIVKHRRCHCVCARTQPAQLSTSVITTFFQEGLSLSLHSFGPSILLRSPRAHSPGTHLHPHSRARSLTILDHMSPAPPYCVC